MTQNLIDSIDRSEHGIKSMKDFDYLIIESNNQTKYSYNKTTIQFDFSKYAKFNYNYALNLAIEHFSEIPKTDWFCFMNNDIICDPAWIRYLERTFNQTNIESLCPNVLHDEIVPRIYKGYILQYNFYGCCFLCTKNVINIVGKFDEQFDFYFQDDDFIEQLRKHNIKHAVVRQSLVTHLGQQTTGKEDLNKLFADRDKFIKKYSKEIYIKRESEKTYANNNRSKL